MKSYPLWFLCDLGSNKRYIVATAHGSNFQWLPLVATDDLKRARKEQRTLIYCTIILDTWMSEILGGTER